MLELDPDAVWSHDEEGTGILYSECCKSEEGPTLSQDIWNKFDMLPTPPRTPSRDTTDLDLGPLPEDLDLEGTLGFDKNFGPIDFPLMEGDVLNIDFDIDTSLPSELTGVMPIDFTSMGSGIACSHGQVHDTCTSCKKLALAGSELRHDCMWIGTCTAEAHAHQNSRIHHDSTCSHINDLMESHGSLETVARFTQLEDDFRDDDDDDDDEGEEDDDDALAYTHMSRPDTPSESSETDSDEEVDKTKYAYGEVHHEEEVFTSGSPASTGLAHSDHTYYCLPPPSPSTKSLQQPHGGSPSSAEPTSSDTEDEIDVVSLGSSVDSGYSSGRHKKRSSSSCNGNSPGKKSKNSGSIVLSNNNDGSKKVLRIHTSTTSSPSASLSGKIKMLHHETPAEGVKLKSRRNSSHSSRIIQKSPKRLQQAAQQQGRGGNRKKSSPRSDADDPDKREIHNSMERLRRVDLKNAFEELRVLIPDLIEKEKAPKVEILKKSAQYCIVVREEERRLLAQVEREKKYRENLLKKLKVLKLEKR